jgi:hypothetical protein
MDRRSFFSVLAGAAALVGLSGTRAARRPAPTPRPVTCPGIQVWNGVACTCPGGLFKCGPDCCGAFGQCCDHACCGEGLVCGAEEICIAA